MAKLNGVMVIDMANGEITKVAYDGAEYVKVDNAKVGDIVVNAKTHRDLTVGAYYEIIKTYGSGAVRVTDDVRDGHDVSRAGQKALFRKVSASKPERTAIDERVDSLEKRVDALEGVEQELKASDFVTIDTDECSIDITAGKAYEVAENSVGILYFVDDGGDKRFGALEDDAYTIVEAPKPTFKTGDIVVITGKGDKPPYRSHQFKIGDKVRVTKTNPDRCYAESSDGSEDWWVLNEYMRHATPAERQAYEASLKPKLKAGDYVKFTSYGRFNPNGISLGKMYEVFIDNDDRLTFVDDDGDKRSYALDSTGAYEIVSPPTAFERAGRKPNEFKKGDIVRVINGGYRKIKGGDIGVVTTDEIDDCPNVSVGIYTHYVYAELIAPVESRVDANNRGEDSCA